MRETDFNIYKKLSQGESLSKSIIPVGILKSPIFNNLLDAGIIQSLKVGRGFKVSVKDKDNYDKFFLTRFPEQEAQRTKGGNIRKYRNSKASRIDSKAVFLFRGFGITKINDELVDLAAHTYNHGLFAAVPSTAIAEKICFVENLETFLKAEKLLGSSYLYVHKYGRIGEKSISAFRSREVLVFVDYDFNGLDEYIRIKNVLPNVSLYVPQDYDDLYHKYSRSLSGNKAIMSTAVKNSDDSVVKRIREQVARNNRFLEQEVLIND